MSNGNKSQSDARKNTEQYRNKYNCIVMNLRHTYTKPVKEIEVRKEINFKRRRENNG